MRWRRRDQVQRQAQVEIAPRFERALIVLATHAQQLDGRLDQIEQRLGDAEDARIEGPSHDDLLQVRVHSARVAAELARVSVELRAEIERATRAAAAAAASPAGSLVTTGRDRRIAVLAEQIIDLSDAFDTRPADLPATG